MKCKMKKMINKSFWFCFVMLFFACNAMDNPPTDKYTDNNFWTSIDKAQNMLNMAYHQLYGAGKMWNDERLTDNVFQARSFTDQRTIRNGLADPSTNIFADEWKGMYEGVKTCNIILEHIDKLEASDNIKQNMKAQARFIRAALYFRLTNFYGAIPFFDKDISLAESNTIGRTSHEAVVAFILKELQEIMKDLPKKEELTLDERGKITRGAALMLMARVYLYESNWQKTAQCCQELMSGQYGKYELFPSYSGLFETKNEYNNEVIFDYAYVPSLRTWGELWDMVPLSKGGRLINTAPTQSLVDNYIMLDGKSIHESSEYDPAHPYQHRDPRLAATVIYDGYKWSENVDDGSVNEVIYTNPSNNTPDAYKGINANSSATGYYIRKYYDPHHEAQMALSTNIICMRYADVLLMYAEAMNELNKMNEAVWNATIRPIRQRAGFTEPQALNFPSNLTQQQMRKLLRVERRSELALEGLRWYDIKRWKAGSEYLNGMVYGARFAPDNHNIQLDVYKFVESRDYLWSIPQSQMDINKNLKPNNLGYAN